MIHKERLFLRSGSAEGFDDAAAEPELALDNHSGLEATTQKRVVRHKIEGASRRADQGPGELLPSLRVSAALGFLHLACEEGAGRGAEIIGFGIEKDDLAGTIAACKEPACEEGARGEFQRVADLARLEGGLVLEHRKLRGKATICAIAMKGTGIPAKRAKSTTSINAMVGPSST